MNNTIIKICSGEYSNPDAYTNVIRYIYNKNFHGGYGFPVYASVDKIIEQFTLSQKYSISLSNRYIWHFVVSIKGVHDYNVLLSLANTIATFFSSHYQVLYSLDLAPGHYHLHFCVNAYSYKPTYTPLTDKILQDYLDLTSIFLSNLYPEKSIQIINEEN